ncbi:hypothetical protein [Azospirillum endophyticum]
MSKASLCLKSIGDHPSVESLKSLLIVVLVGFIVGGTLVLLAGRAGVFITVLLALPWSIVLLILTIKLIASPFESGRYKRAREAVMNGSICGWVIRKSGLIVIIDEGERKIYFDGTIYSFDKIRRVQWEIDRSSKTLEIILSEGDSPILKIPHTSKDSLMENHAKLCNSLGFA